MNTHTDKPKRSDATRTGVGLLLNLWFVVLAMAALGIGPATANSDSAYFEDLSGTTVGLSEYQGSVVVLNFWATWCSPCLIEIPHLVDLHQRLEPLNATVIGLTLDSGDARIIKQFWKTRLEIEPTYPLWLASVDQAADLFDVHTFPQTLLIDRNGKIQKRLIGLQTENELWNALQDYL